VGVVINLATVGTIQAIIKVIPVGSYSFSAADYGTDGSHAGSAEYPARFGNYANKIRIDCQRCNNRPAVLNQVQAFAGVIRRKATANIQHSQRLGARQAVIGKKLTAFQDGFNVSIGVQAL